MASLKQAPFTRILTEGDEGVDVEGVGRALCRAGYGVKLSAFNGLKQSVRRTWGPRKIDWCNALEADLGHKVNGRYELAQHKALLPSFDARAANFMVLYVPPAAMCYPLPKGAGGSLCQGVHVTSGIPGNVAHDWCAGPHTPILAVEDAWITRLSGSDPDDDTPDPSGAFGWSIYYTTRAGKSWYWTHLGRRVVREGQQVKAGQTIGYVGDQEFRPDHTHGGVSSSLGVADATRHLKLVEASPRVQALA